MRTPYGVDWSRIAATLKLQYPSVDVEKLLTSSEVKVKHSKKTRRVNYIYADNRLIFSLRNSDGRFIPTYEGGIQLLKYGLDNYQIHVAEEAVPFVSDGRTLFNKHVVSADPIIRPNSDVFLMDDHKLIAIGIARQPGYAMMELKSGTAARVRQCINKHATSL